MDATTATTICTTIIAVLSLIKAVLETLKRKSETKRANNLASVAKERTSSATILERVLRGVSTGVKEACDLGLIDKSAVLDAHVKPALQAVGPGVLDAANKLLEQFGTKVSNVKNSKS